MTPERARYILDNKLLGGEFRMAFRESFRTANARIFPDGITEAEDAEIKALWKEMPGSTCYFDAVVRIARGPLISTDDQMPEKDQIVVTVTGSVTTGEVLQKYAMLCGSHLWRPATKAEAALHHAQDRFYAKHGRYPVTDAEIAEWHVLANEEA